MLERIEGKHVSLQVKPEHYPIVGKYLLGAIQQVLGDAATPEILDAWAAAYGQLADIMIGQEKKLSDSAAALGGGWHGFKSFRVERKVQESEFMFSFYLVPEDGTSLPPSRRASISQSRFIRVDIRMNRSANTACRPTLTVASTGSASSGRLRRQTVLTYPMAWSLITCTHRCSRGIDSPSTCLVETSRCVKEMRQSCC